MTPLQNHPQRICIIRPFRRKDAPQIARMMQKLAAFHGDTAQSKPQDFIKHCLGSPKIAHTWLAWQNGKAAGFLIAYDRMNFVSAQKTRVIDLLFVEESFRRLGLGQALLAAAAKDALKRDCETLLVTAKPANAIADRFYRKIGLNYDIKTSARYRCGKDGMKKLARNEKAE